MTKTKIKTIPFSEMRHLLRELGYREKTVANAHVFHRAKKDLVIFRRYDAAEAVDWGDIVSTRKFLDMRGLLDAEEFDARLETKVKPA
jgi:hypothetical protein